MEILALIVLRDRHLPKIEEVPPLKLGSFISGNSQSSGLLCHLSPAVIKVKRLLSLFPFFSSRLYRQLYRQQLSSALPLAPPQTPNDDPLPVLYDAAFVENLLAGTTKLNDSKDDVSPPLNGLQVGSQSAFFLLFLS